MAAKSDLVALLPQSFATIRIQRSRMQAVIKVFDLPLTIGGISVSQLWHPRLEADAGHRWLRGLVLKATAT